MKFDLSLFGWLYLAAAIIGLVAAVASADWVLGSAATCAGIASFLFFAANRSVKARRVADPRIKLRLSEMKAFAESEDRIRRRVAEWLRGRKS